MFSEHYKNVDTEILLTLLEENLFNFEKYIHYVCVCVCV